MGDEPKVDAIPVRLLLEPIETALRLLGNQPTCGIMALTAQQQLKHVAALLARLAAAEAVMEALPMCSRRCGHRATHERSYMGQAAGFFCDTHALGEYELPYADELRTWEKLEPSAPLRNGLDDNADPMQAARAITAFLNEKPGREFLMRSHEGGVCEIHFVDPDPDIGFIGQTRPGSAVNMLIDGANDMLNWLREDGEDG